jgi:hypothetical protein
VTIEPRFDSIEPMGNILSWIIVRGVLSRTTSCLPAENIYHFFFVKKDMAAHFSTPQSKIDIMLLLANGGILSRFWTI